MADLFRWPTVRLRLTLLFGTLFVLAGAVLLALNFALVSRNLPVDEVTFSGPAGGVVMPALPLGPTGEHIIDGQHAEDVFRDLPVRVRSQALGQLVNQSITALAVTSVASMGLGWVLAGRVLRPIGEITATARRLSGQNLQERIALTGPDDELKELADTFDEMLARLDATFDSQRRFVANASHQLRTPLAIIRAEIEVSLADPESGVENFRAMASKVAGAVARSERLIDALLTLARGERPIGAPEPADLASAAELALAQVSAEVRALDLRAETTLDPAPVQGDPALLEELAANLVENAVRHNRQGGWIHVTTGETGNHSLLRVANTGSVVDPVQIDSLFEPFQRGDDGDRRSPGVGLGLSIVRAVATAHGGQVRARAFGDGGLEVAVKLPRATARSGTEPIAGPHSR